MSGHTGDKLSAVFFLHFLLSLIIKMYLYTSATNEDEEERKWRID